MSGPPFDPIDRAAQLWRERWGPDAAPVEMVTATAIMRVQQLVLGRLDALVGAHGLTFARYEALVLLAFSGSGRLPMSLIGERLMVHPTSATSIVRRLQAQGFVDRIPNPSDGRGTLAVITDRGRAAMTAATADLVADRFGLGMLTGTQHHDLAEALRQIRAGRNDLPPTSGEPASDAEPGAPG